MTFGFQIGLRKKMSHRFVVGTPFLRIFTVWIVGIVEWCVYIRKTNATLPFFFKMDLIIRRLLMCVGDSKYVNKKCFANNAHYSKAQLFCSSITSYKAIQHCKHEKTLCLHKKESSIFNWNDFTKLERVFIRIALLFRFFW